MTSQAQLCVDGVFQVEISINSNGHYVAIPDLVHERSELTQEINKAARHVHVFTTVNLNVVDVLTKTLVLQPSPIVRIRIGTSKADGVFWFPWQNHLLVSFSAEPSGKGYQIVFSTSDMLETMSRQYFTRAHTGLISEMVAYVAKINGLQTVIEPTVGSWSFIQSQQSDFDFLAMLAARSVNGYGLGGFRFFILDNVLHFHTLDYYSTLRVANVFSLPNSLTNVEANVQDALNEGATGVRIVGVDPLQGVEYSVSSNRNLVLTLGNQTPYVKDLRSYFIGRHPSANSIEELRAIGQNIFAAARSRLFSCTAYVERGYPVRVNDLIRIVYNSPSAQQSPWGGLYTTVGVKHVVTKGVSNSVISLERGEFETTNMSRSPRLPDGTSVDSDFSAEGHPVDLTAISSSEKTKGPPDSFTGGRYVKTVKVN